MRGALPLARRNPPAGRVDQGTGARCQGNRHSRPNPTQPQPQPQPPPRAQVFGEVLRLRHSRLWRFSYGACSLPYHAIVWYHVRTSLSTFLPATSLRARGPSEREPVDHDGPEAWAAYLDGVRARERVRERGRRHRAARAARQRAVRAMGRVELPPAICRTVAARGAWPSGGAAAGLRQCWPFGRGRRWTVRSRSEVDLP